MTRVGVLSMKWLSNSFASKQNEVPCRICCPCCQPMLNVIYCIRDLPILNSSIKWHLCYKGKELRSSRFIWYSDGRLPWARWTTFRRFEDCCWPSVWASSVEAFKESDAHGCGTAKCMLPAVARCEWRCKQWCCWFCTTLYYNDKKCSAAGTDVLTIASNLGWSEREQAMAMTIPGNTWIWVYW